MRKCIVTACVLLVALSALVACDDPMVYQDMVYMDRSFVAALQLTEGDEYVDNAVLSLTRLKMRWSLFSKGYRDYFADDIQWRDTIDRVGDMIDQAARDSQTGEMRHAHQILLEIRDMLHDARRRNNMPYIMDYYTEYQETLDLLVAAGADGVIDDSEFGGIERLAPEAEARWDRIAKFDLNNSLYELDSSARAKYDEALVAEAGILTRLVSLHKQGNRRDMPAVINALRAPFDRAYSSLGYYYNLK